MTCIETTKSMTQQERDTINRANTLPNSEQVYFAHQRRLRFVQASTTERRAHNTECVSCSTWINS